MSGCSSHGAVLSHTPQRRPEGPLLYLVAGQGGARTTFGLPPLHKGHACSFNSTLLGWHSGELRGCLKRRLWPPGTHAALPPESRTPEHVVDRAWDSKSSEVRSGSLSWLQEQPVSFGPGHRQWTALWFRGCRLPGREGLTLGIVTSRPHSTLWRFDSSPRSPGAPTRLILLG